MTEELGGKGNASIDVCVGAIWEGLCNNLRGINVCITVQLLLSNRRFFLYYISNLPCLCVFQISVLYEWQAMVDILAPGL